MHPCIISYISPTRCTILFNIFIYFSSLHVSRIHVPIIRRKLLYLCDTGIFHCVWVASGLLVGLKLCFNPTSRPDAPKHVEKRNHHHHHHHHHHVHEGLGVFPVPWSSRWSWSLHLFLGCPMFLRPFGLYCSAHFGSLFVSILCMWCSHFS